MIGEASWAEAAERIELEDGFTAAPCAHEVGGHASLTLGWNLYTPSGVIFAWAGSLVEIAEKVAGERRERLFSRASCL